MSDAITNADVLNLLGFLTGRVHTLIRRRVQFYLDQAGVPLKMENYPTMHRLMQADRISQQDIADQTGFDRHRISRMLDELEQAGLISRENHPDNRREKLIVLTELGQQSVAAIGQAVTQATHDALGAMSPERSLAIVDALQTMTKNLTN